MCMYYPASAAATEQNKAERKRSRGILNMIQYMSDRLPREYYDWESAQFDRIIFYRKQSRKKYIGYCECGAEVPLTSARSSRKIQCPACGHTVRLTKTVTDHFRQTDYFAYITAADGGWIQRLFVAYKGATLQKDGTVRIDIHRYEEQRDYFDGETVRYFHPVWGGDDRWIAGEGHKHGMGWTGWRIGDMYLHTFPGNLDALFRNSKYRYSALDIATEHSLVNPFYYLSRYDKDPKLEMLYKLGLYRVAEQLLYERYGFDSKRLIREIKSLKDLGVYGKEDLAECSDMTVEQIIARKEVKAWNLPKEHIPTAIAFVVKANSLSGADFEYSFMSHRQRFKYYLTQSQAYKEPSLFIRDYTDYIGECMTLGYDLNDPQITKPKDLSAAHARTLSAVKYKRTEEQRENFCTQAQKWLEKGYTDGVFAIAVIPTPDDLVREAAAMHNCSAGYADRIAQGNCSIWTVRRCESPDAAFYMLELSRDGRVIQCRGVANSAGYCGQPPATPEVKAFVDKWLKQKISPIIKKEIYAKAI